MKICGVIPGRAHAQVRLGCVAVSNMLCRLGCDPGIVVLVGRALLPEFFTLVDEGLAHSSSDQESIRE